MQLLDLPESQSDQESKYVESILDMEAVVTSQLKTFTKENFQNCFRK